MNKLLKEARILLMRSCDPVYGGSDHHHNRIKAFLAKTKPPIKRAKKANAARKQEGAARHRVETARIREAVFARAGGICEVAGCSRLPTEMDHWLGGSGRRRQKQSVETCWAVCGLHYVALARRTPDAPFWNAVFHLHCLHHGYPLTESAHFGAVTAGAAPGGHDE